MWFMMYVKELFIGKQMKDDKSTIMRLPRRSTPRNDILFMRLPRSLRSLAMTSQSLQSLAMTGQIYKKEESWKK
jgi:hypothetical protein